MYTRNYIISFVAGLPDTNFAAQRLLKNQVDIGNAIKPYYGNEAGNKLTSLLKGHIMGAVELLKAAKAGNTTGVAAAEKKWNSNADQIATFLSTANPNWSKADLKTMLDNYLSSHYQKLLPYLAASIQMALQHLIRFISRQW